MERKGRRKDVGERGEKTGQGRGGKRKEERGWNKRKDREKRRLGIRDKGMEWENERSEE